MSTMYMETCSECDQLYEHYGPAEKQPTCNACQTKHLYEFLEDHPEYDPESPWFNPSYLR